MNLDWLASNDLQVKKFLVEPTFYREPLHNILSISTPFGSIEDCENAFVITQKFLRTKKNSSEQQDTLLCCFSLAMLCYLITYEDYKYEMHKITTEKGSFHLPVLISHYLGRKGKSQVISSAYRAMVLTGKRDSFKRFYWYITDIPPVAQI